MHGLALCLASLVDTGPETPGVIAGSGSPRGSPSFEGGNHEVSHVHGKPSKLPSPLLVGRSPGRLDRLQAIDHWSQAVVGKMGCCRSMACRSRNCHRRRIRSLPGRSVCRDSRTLGDAGFDLASSPRPTDFHSLVRPIIRTVKFEQREQMVCAIRGPSRKQAVLGKAQWPTSVGRDKSRVTHNRSPSTHGGEQWLAATR